MSTRTASSIASTNSSEHLGDILMRELDTDLVCSLALTVRGRSLSLSSPLTDFTCSISSPPKRGSFNVVYEVKFSDGVSWAVRVPCLPWNAEHERAMRLDMTGLQYVTDHTSLPVPRLHAYDCTANNALGHPYLVADYVHGTRLVDVWSDPSWWTGERSKQRLLTAIAGYMVELSKHEFEQIGCLDRVQPDGPYRVVPFPADFPMDDELDPSPPDFGPFTSTNTYLRALVDGNYRNVIEAHRNLVAILRMYLAILPDPRYDGAPFTLSHPDFDSQNILLDDSGNIAAFVDWDGIAAMPRQLGALSYPSWLTVDWDPDMYDGYRTNPHHDTDADLHAHRKFYSDAVDAISGGTLGDVVRNSHVVSTLGIAASSPLQMPEIVMHLGTYVFRTGRNFALDLMIELEHGAWYNQDPKEVAQIVDEGRVKQSSDDSDSDGDEEEDSDDDGTSDEDEQFGDDADTSDEAEGTTNDGDDDDFSLTEEEASQRS